MSCLIPRGARRRRPPARSVKWRGLLTVTAASTMLLVGTPAMADKGAADVVSLNDPAIVVESNGNHYTKVALSGTNVEGEIRVVLDAERVGRVARFEIWPQMYWGPFVKAFKGTGMSHVKSYSVPRPNQVDRTFSFSIPRAFYNDAMVAACNWHADQLRSQGQANGAIFSQDRVIELPFGAGLDYQMTGAGSAGEGPRPLLPHKLSVTCKGLPPRVPAPVAENPTRDKPPEVESVSLTIIERGSLRGSCELELTGTIKTAEPNATVKFRFESDEGQLSDIKTVTTGSVRTRLYDYRYPLSPGGTRRGSIRVKGTNFASEWVYYQVNCGVAGQDYSSADPSPPQLAIDPPTVTIEAHGRGEKMVQGFICPTEAVVFAGVTATDAFNGRAIYIAEQQRSLYEPLSQVQEFNFSVANGQHLDMTRDFELRWSNVRIVGGNPPKQTMTFTFQLAWNHTKVGEAQKTVELSCRKPQTSAVGRGAVGGEMAGRSPTHAPQAAIGQMAGGQAQSLAIQAPKGLVRKGEIRLSGGAVNGKYTLSFLRKNGGGYVTVNAAQLPKQMTGPVASFPLQALTGGRDWRIEVCPEGGAPAACKTADFRLTRIGGAGAASAPGPQREQPQGTPIFVLPGVAN